LAEFIENRGSKVTDKVIHVGWEIEEAKSKLRRQQMSWLEILCEALQGPCVENCKEQWLELALDIVPQQYTEFSNLRCVSFSRKDEENTGIFS